MRLVLTVETGGLANREFVLDRGSLVLGRDPACSVRFDPWDSQVSRRHAVIEAVEGGFRLTDQRSTNGTHVNQARVESAALQSGDVVQLGAQGPRLRVRIDAAAAPEEAPLPEAHEARDLRPSIADRSLYDPARDKGKRYSVGGVLAILAMMGIGGFLGMLVALMTAFELGPGAAFVGVMVAFAPAPIYLLIWLWLDRNDPEPAWALAGCIAWGAGAATFLSSIANTAFGVIMASITQNPGFAQFLSASISAPIVEEATKGLAVLLIFLVLRREFDGVLDGIVYAGVVALGFATVENVLYYGRVVAKEGAPGLIAVFILRGVLGPFGHSVFTSMIGIGCGIARETHNTALRFVAPVVGYFGAVFLHFLWNTLAGLSGSLFGFLLVYVVIWVPLFLVFFAAVIWMGHRESRLIRRQLEHEVKLGLITVEQADIAGSWMRRMAWLLSSLGDLTRLGARRQFLQAATRLALSYWHVERAQAAGGLTMSFGQIPRFRKDLERLRAAV
jgi:RsiW-degrading membrane proteinase PrsW (M82 family)